MKVRLFEKLILINVYLAFSLIANASDIPIVEQVQINKIDGRYQFDKRIIDLGKKKYLLLTRLLDQIPSEKSVLKEDYKNVSYGLYVNSGDIYYFNPLTKKWFPKLIALPFDINEDRLKNVFFKKSEVLDSLKRIVVQSDGILTSSAKLGEALKIREIYDQLNKESENFEKEINTPLGHVSIHVEEKVIKKYEIRDNGSKEIIFSLSNDFVDRFKFDLSSDMIEPPSDAKEASLWKIKNDPKLLAEKGFVGAELREVNGRYLVGTVNPKSPASMAGLKDGMEIVSINHHSVCNLSQDEILKLTKLSDKVLYEVKSLDGKNLLNFEIKKSPILIMEAPSLPVPLPNNKQ